MKWSKEQKQAHEESFDRFRQDYVKGENKTTSLEDITNCRKRCVTLIHRFYDLSRISNKIANFNKQIRNKIPGFYFQEIPHFTIDCHRYLTGDELPDNINEMDLEGQRKLVITPEEFEAYDKVLREEIGKEKPYNFEIKGVAFGGDGLRAQVWYDDERLLDFNDRLGQRVKRETPSMDFVWGVVKRKIPCRVVNLTRFTGEENGQKVIELVENNRGKKFGKSKTGVLDLYCSDHYLQKKNTHQLRYYFHK